MFNFRSLVTTFTRIPSRNKLTYYHNIKRVQPVNNCSWKIRKMSSSEDEVEVTPAFQKEKDEYLQMPLEEKRKLYKGGNHVGLEDVPTWEEYFKTEVAGDTKEDESKEVSEMDCKLSKLVSMWRGDITQLEIDAIVNAANSSLAGGGGVDGAIHRAAGKSITAECRTLKGCDVGEAKITGGYKLPAKYVIHTVGPQSELPEKLESCYTSSLQLLLDSNLRTVAFPCISTGIYGYPQAAAAKIAISTVRKFLEEHSDKLDRVLFCIFLQEDEKLYKALMQKYFPVSLK